MRTLLLLLSVALLSLTGAAQGYTAYPLSKIKSVEVKIKKDILAGPVVNSSGETIMLTGKGKVLKGITAFITNKNFSAIESKSLKMPVFKGANRVSIIGHFKSGDELVLLVSAGKYYTFKDSQVSLYSVIFNLKSKTLSQPQKINTYTVKGFRNGTTDILSYTSEKENLNLFAVVNFSIDKKAKKYTYDIEMYSLDGSKPVLEYTQKNIKADDANGINFSLQPSGDIIGTGGKDRLLLTVVNEEGVQQKEIEISDKSIFGDEDYTLINYAFDVDDNFIYLSGAVRNYNKVQKVKAVNKVFFMKLNLDGLSKAFEKVYKLDEEFIKEGRREREIKKTDKQKEKMQKKGENDEIGIPNLHITGIEKNAQTGNLILLSEISYSYVTCSGDPKNRTCTTHFINEENILFCINPKTGEMTWKTKVLKRQHFYNTLVFNGTLYRLKEDGDLVLIYADGKNVYDKTRGNVNMTIVSPEGLKTNYSLIREKRSYIYLSRSLFLNDHTVILYVIANKTHGLYKITL